MSFPIDLSNRFSRKRLHVEYDDEFPDNVVDDVVDSDVNNRNTLSLSNSEKILFNDNDNHSDIDEYEEIDFDFDFDYLANIAISMEHGNIMLYIKLIVLFAIIVRLTIDILYYY